MTVYNVQNTSGNPLPQNGDTQLAHSANAGGAPPVTQVANRHGNPRI